MSWVRSPSRRCPRRSSRLRAERIAVVTHSSCHHAARVDRRGSCSGYVKRANEILRRASAHFAEGGARSPTEVIVTFVDEHRDEYEVEPICDVLPIAPSTYYEHRARNEDPERRPQREKRDEQLRPEIQRVWTDNYAVYGADKVWRQLGREKHDVARCTVERPARDMGPHGAVRGRAFTVTKVADENAMRPPNLVHSGAVQGSRRELDKLARHVSWGYPCGETRP